MKKPLKSRIRRLKKLREQQDAERAARNTPPPEPLPEDTIASLKAMQSAFCEGVRPRAAVTGMSFDGKEAKMDTEQIHATIWLAPWCDDCHRNDNNPDTGRSWCQDNVYDPCEECGRLPVKYIIAPDQPQPEPTP